MPAFGSDSSVAVTLTPQGGQGVVPQITECNARLV